MLKYILKRILLFIPTLLIISIAVFFLNQQAPGDQVEVLLSGGQENSGGLNSKSDVLANENAYIEKWEELGLNKPAFYFAIKSLAQPDTLHKVPKKATKATLKRLLNQSGNWEAVNNYHNSIKELDATLLNGIADSSMRVASVNARAELKQLYLQYDPQKIQKSLDKISSLGVLDNSANRLHPILAAYQRMDTDKTLWKKYVPTFQWNGFDNQYHTWITNLLTFNLGLSYTKKVPVAQLIGQNIGWTMLLSFISIILAYLISIPLGVFMGRMEGTWVDGLITTMLFLLYSLPSFWVATLLITYLCQPLYMDYFPPYGVGEIDPSMTILEKLNLRLYHLVLPIFCWTYGSFAFLSRQMRGGMIDVLRQDYIRTAKSKGLDDSKVIWKHGFKNSLLRIITMFAGVFPAMISGSVVLEVIFSIPGMGKLLYDALAAKDFPIIFSLVMLSALLTMVGNLIADIMYASVDPRIRFK